MESHNIEITKDIFFSALKAVDPYSAVDRHIPHILSTYQNGGFNKLLLVCFWKAAFLMTKSICDRAWHLVTGGVVITKYGHALGKNLHSNIELYEACHPGQKWQKDLPYIRRRKYGNC